MLSIMSKIKKCMASGDDKEQDCAVVHEHGNRCVFVVKTSFEA